MAMEWIKVVEACSLQGDGMINRSNKKWPTMVALVITILLPLKMRNHNVENIDEI